MTIIKFTCDAAVTCYKGAHKAECRTECKTFATGDDTNWVAFAPLGALEHRRDMRHGATYGAEIDRTGWIIPAVHFTGNKCQGLLQFADNIDAREIAVRDDVQLEKPL